MPEPDAPIINLLVGTLVTKRWMQLRRRFDEPDQLLVALATAQVLTRVADATDDDRLLDSVDEWLAIEDMEMHLADD